MFRLPILLSVLGTVGYFLYKNEQERRPVGHPTPAEEQSPMLPTVRESVREPLANQPVLESDSELSDSSVDIEDINLN